MAFDLTTPGMDVRNTIFLTDPWDWSKSLPEKAVDFCSQPCQEKHLVKQREQFAALIDTYCPFKAGPVRVAEGKVFTFQPPPKALISSTLADMRRRRMSTATLWFANAVLCAVRTSR
jgi:hypothetical protein